ncbi:MAG: DUF3106 domain-containing protein [Planctomycetes bacterium]|nr:DUF3106 domain-containing protein [Planctomycetota bacterium]MBI3848244.1 DUF3106 domain-containing protein [Planctomycetota bacterium]
MRALITLVLSFLVSMIASAQEVGPPPPDALRENFERWKKLPPEEQRRIRENHERWKRLSAEEREQVRRRHEAFEEQERRGLRETPTPERERIEKLPPFEHRREMHRVVEERMRRMKEQFLKNLPDDQRQQLEQLQPPEREQQFRRLFFEKIERDQRQFLDDQVNAGRLDAAERDRILSLPPPARGPEIGRLRHRMNGDRDRDDPNEPEHRRGRFHGIDEAERLRIESLPEAERRGEWDKLHKEDFLKHPPQWWQEISTDERTRLEALPPIEFFHELRRFAPERSHSRGDGPR